MARKRHGIYFNRKTKEIVSTAMRTGGQVRGPIPLPTWIEKFCVLRSPLPTPGYSTTRTR